MTVPRLQAPPCSLPSSEPFLLVQNSLLEKSTMGVTRRQPPSAASQSANGSTRKSNTATSPSTISAANHHLHHHNPVPDAVADIPSPKYVTPMWVKATLLLFCAITVLAWPGHWHPLDRQGRSETSVRYVFFYGWLTALSTGLGVLPFALLPDVADYWVGISNGAFDAREITS